MAIPFIKIRQASQVLSQLSTSKKNQILKDCAVALHQAEASILRANALDIKHQPGTYQLFDRLQLTPQRLASIRTSVLAVTKLPDPVGVILKKSSQPNGLHLRKVRVPFGVIGIIYEARPNVTIEIFSLCLKTGNAMVLRGSRDAYQSNRAIVKTLHAVLRKHRLPKDVVYLVDPYDHSAGDSMLTAHGFIDVLIPRGSNRLIQHVREHATVPVIETGAGVCHTYVEKTADLEMAERLVVNAKTRRYTVCNVLDCLVVDQAITQRLLPRLAKALAPHAITLYADSASYQVLQNCYPKQLLRKANLTHFGKEWLAPTLSIKTVANFTAGLQFVQAHTSGHSEAIVTNAKQRAEQFSQLVDAAAVYVNTSTAFTDGFEFGLGAEVGISTQKLHARGPMGLAELTTYKWIVTSAGAIRAS